MAEYNFHHHFSEYPFGIFNADWREDKTPAVPYSLGLHPMDITENWEQDFAKIKEKSSEAQCLAIGECGLDARVKASEAVQEAVFMAHINLANELQKPIIIHCVRRFHRLAFFKKKAKSPMIIHGFNKNEALAQSLIQQGFFLSFGKALTKEEKLQNTLKTIGTEAIFFETDNDPIAISEIYRTASEIVGKSENWLREKIQENRKKIGL